MQFIYAKAILPDNKALAITINAAAAELEKKITSVTIQALPLSSYSKAYYSEYMHKLQFTLQACCFNLIWAIHKTNKPIEDITLVDSGAGLGMLSLLAKLAGIKTVCYNDIFEIVYQDAQIFSAALHIPIDHFILGDAENIVEYVQEKKIVPDIITSRNTVEHIYNLNNYFQVIKDVSNHPLVLFFSTTSNPKNVLTVLYLKKLHKKVESKYINPLRGDKSVAKNKPFIIVRENIISTHFPELNHDEVKKLAYLTRGKMTNEIISTVNAYKTSGNWPELKVYSTNTCDPTTGGWAENLLPIDYYQNYFTQNGFNFTVIPGFYNTHYEQKMLNLITPQVNSIIRKSKYLGLRLAPFIGFMGERK